MLKRLLLICALLSFSYTNAYALSLTLENTSKWEIHELYFSDTDEEEWGPDQLGDEVIETGDSFTLTKIGKGNYDVKIVDEDGDSCVVSDVDFTSSEHFTITDKILLGCQVATEAEEADEEE